MYEAGFQKTRGGLGKPQVDPISTIATAGPKKTNWGEERTSLPLQRSNLGNAKGRDTRSEYNPLT